MWIENNNIEWLSQNENKERKDIKKYKPNMNKEMEIKKNEIKKQDNIEADRLIAHPSFDVPQWKEISEWKVNFEIADLKWNLDIDSDKLTINDKIYKITMPKWADLVWVTILDWKIHVKWKVWWFTGGWNMSDEVFKKEMIKLASQDIKEDIIHTKSWDVILSKL